MREPERNRDQTPISDDVARRILETAAAIDKGRSEAEDHAEDAQLTIAELREAADTLLLILYQDGQARSSRNATGRG